VKLIYHASSQFTQLIWGLTFQGFTLQKFRDVT